MSGVPAGGVVRPGQLPEAVTVHGQRAMHPAVCVVPGLLCSSLQEGVQPNHWQDAAGPGLTGALAAFCAHTAGRTHLLDRCLSCMHRRSALLL